MKCLIIDILHFLLQHFPSGADSVTAARSRAPSIYTPKAYSRANSIRSSSRTMTSIRAR